MRNYFVLLRSHGANTGAELSAEAKEKAIKENK